MLVLTGHEDSVRCLAYSTDGRTLASGSDDQTVRLWNLVQARELAVLPHESWVESLAFSPDGKILVTGLADGGINLWDIGKNKLQHQFEPHADGVRALAYSPTGEMLATGSWDRSIRLYSHIPYSRYQLYAPGTKPPTMAIHQQPAAVTSLAFSPDGKAVLVGTQDGSLQVIELAHRETAELPAGQSPVFAVSVSGDGRTFASGHADGSVILWDADSSEKLAVLKGHTWTVYSLAFSPDGQTLLSGSADGTVRMWAVPGQCERSAFKWHKGWVTSVAFAPDGMTAAAGSGDRSIVIWDVM